VSRSRCLILRTWRWKPWTSLSTNFSAIPRQNG